MVTAPRGGATAAQPGPTRGRFRVNRRQRPEAPRVLRPGIGEPCEHRPQVLPCRRGAVPVGDRSRFLPARGPTRHADLAVAVWEPLEQRLGDQQAQMTDPTRGRRRRDRCFLALGGRGVRAALRDGVSGHHARSPRRPDTATGGARRCGAPAVQRPRIRGRAQTQRQPRPRAGARRSIGGRVAVDRAWLLAATRAAELGVRRMAGPRAHDGIGEVAVDQGDLAVGHKFSTIAT